MSVTVSEVCGIGEGKLVLQEKIKACRHVT